MANLDTSLEGDLRKIVGPDSTATLETGGNFAASDPTRTASSESLYAAGKNNAARSTDDDLDEDDEDEDLDEDEDDDDLDEDEDDDEEDEDEDEDEDDDDLEDDEDEDDLDDEDEDEDDEDA